MPWQQNKRLALLYQKVDEQNHQDQLDRLEKKELIKLTLISKEIIEDFNLQINQFKKEVTGSMYDKLKDEMFEYSNVLALDKIANATKNHLNDILYDMVKSAIIELSEKE